jgi:hypothetical protein
MNGIKMFMLAFFASVVWQIPTTAQGAPSAAQKVMNECALQYCGHRSPSVRQSRPMLIESCFRQKMGRSPVEMGITIKVRQGCRRR